jgi:S1-C subfamily serine protease
VDALGLNLASVPVGRVIVQSVEPGSPADQVGIGAGDLLLSINGMRVTSPDQANSIIARIPKGSQVTLQLVQGSEQIQATIQESNGP